MTAAIELLHVAAAAGAEFKVTGDRLTVSAPRPLPRDLVEELRREKPALIKLLSGQIDPDRTGPAPTSAWWISLFYERCDHRELFGRRSPAEAAVLAFGDLIVEWHRRYGSRISTEQCAACGRPFTDDPFDIDDGVRVHFDNEFACIRRYGFAARSAAVTGLRALGIEPPDGFVW